MAIIAVSVAGTFVYKFVKENAKLDDIKLDVYIDTSKGLPCYNPGNQMLSLYIHRGAGSANLTGIKISAGTASLINRYALKELETYQYSLLGLEPGNLPSSVKIAPLVMLDGKEKQLKVYSEAKIVSSYTCSRNSATDSGFNVRSEGGGGGGDNPPPGTIVVPAEPSIPELPSSLSSLE